MKGRFEGACALVSSNLTKVSLSVRLQEEKALKPIKHNLSGPLSTGVRQSKAANTPDVENVE